MDIHTLERLILKTHQKVEEMTDSARRRPQYDGLLQRANGGLEVLQLLREELDRELSFRDQEAA